MKTAFGPQKELYVRALVGETIALTIDQYDALVKGANAKQMCTVQGRRPNRSLNSQEQLPLWRWSFKRYGGITTAFWRLLALGRFPVVAGIRWFLTSHFPWEFFIVTAVLMVEETLLSLVLDISMRYVCYIHVGRNKVSDATKDLWQSLIENSTL